MAPLEARAHAIADELLDRVRDTDRFEVVAGLAAPLPVRMIAELFGFPPEDFARLKRWSDDMAPLVDSDLQRSAPASRLISMLRFRRRVLQLIELRRREPRADLLSALAQAHYVNGELSKDEVVGVVVFVLTAGHSTTTHLIGSCVLLLLNHPRELGRLREDPSLVECAIEETLRVESPVQRTGRVLREDVELHGQRMPRGAKVRLMIGAANRDPRRFDDPDRFDILRRDSNRHLAFGMGIHHCIGLHLARLEARAAIGALVRRFPRLALTSSAPRWTTGAKLRGLAELIVSV
jgi:cytochrome P450